MCIGALHLNVERLKNENHMNNPKQKAKNLIENLPDNVTWDDIIYEMYIKQKISAGLKAAEEGRVVSHQDAKKRLL